MLEVSEIKDWIALYTVEGIGPRRFVSLVNHFGTPGKVLKATGKALSEVPEIGKETANNIKTKVDWTKTDEQIELLKKFGFSFLTYKDENYPENLKSIYDFPPFLFIKGEIKREDKKALAIVGTRLASFYGKSITEKIAKELSLRGITIVSGMARGIDSISHISALEQKGRTIAIFGSGLDIVYPPEHKDLAERIAQNGACISEFLLGTAPLAENFPKRNRLISGLSLGVIIVEAPKKSGALLTAECALEQNREVFAVPGNIGSKRSEGTNWLIKQGASLVTSVDDILKELEGILAVPQREIKKEVIGSLSPEEQKIYQLLTSEPYHIDKIAKDSQMNTAQALSTLLSLELKDLVKQLSGKMFVRV